MLSSIALMDFHAMSPSQTPSLEQSILKFSLVRRVKVTSTPVRGSAGFCQHPERQGEKALPYEAIILAVVNVLKALYFLTTGSFYKVNREEGYSQD